MIPLRSRLGLALSAVYLAIFALSGLYAIYSLTFHTANSEFCGLPAILVTLPWSLPLIQLMNSLGYVTWYEHVARHPAVYGFFAMLGLLPAALINALAYYFIGKILNRAMAADKPNSADQP